MKWAIEHPEEMRRLGEKGYLYSKDGKAPDIENHCEELVEYFNYFTQRAQSNLRKEHKGKTE
jgi:hypothetical protein